MVMVVCKNGGLVLKLYPMGLELFKFLVDYEAENGSRV